MNSTSIGLIRSLDDVGVAETGQVGSKAANLGELKRAGFPVPVGVVDVLVCRITSPVWSVLFPSVGALVTDTGGVLSHPAIIAREYRVPAVVATGNATALLHDDQVVTVDGTAGKVETLR